MKLPHFSPALVAAVLTASATCADVPKVATDIAPVHSLVSRVLGDLGEAHLLLPAGASPHDHALRPSDARALGTADLVFWIGPPLTPWLERSLDSIADQAQVTALMASEGTQLLGFREGPVFGQEATDSEADGHEDEHAHEHEHDHGHDDHAADPHAWLDPGNARSWLETIARILATRDPENAEVYRANAARARAEITDLERQLTTQMAPLAGVPYFMFHDGLHYFEHRFGVEALGTLALSDARKPGAARLSAARDAIRTHDVVCVLVEPQYPDRLARAATEGTGAQIGTVDILGAEVALGPDLYLHLLSGIADDLEACLSAP